MAQVAISVGLAPSLEAVFSKDPQSREILRQRLSRGVGEILEILGIPGEVSVELHAFEPDRIDKDRFLAITINEQLCRYSDELLRLVYSYVGGIPPFPRLKPTESLAKLDTETGEESLVEFLSLAGLEIIKKQPELLVARPQVLDYAKSLPPLQAEADLKLERWPPDPNWLLPVLRAVLGLRLSIANKVTVAETLQKGLSDGKSQEDIVEDLVVSLRPDVIEIQLPQDYLREITTADDENSRKQFSLMRDGLFYESGLRYPDFRFVPVENLKPKSFAFKINHLVTLPRIGLGVGQYLINDICDRLRLLDIYAEPAINPAISSECAIIESRFRRKAESDHNLRTWDTIGFLVLSFAADLKENSACFLDRQATQDHIAQLEQEFPELVKTSQKNISVEQLTRVLRKLIAEEISIRNFRPILELIVDYDYIVADPRNYIIFDDRLPTRQQPNEMWQKDPVNIASYVRAGLKRYISHKFARGQNALVVYLLDPKIEEFLSWQALQNDRFDEIQREAILKAVRKKIEPVSSTASIPSVLTTIDVRPVFRDLIAPEFPRVPVLAHQELLPELKIQPIDRISL